MALVALVLLIASVFMMMTAGAGDSVAMGQKQASRAQYNRRTNYAAYGAMQMALDKLTTDLTYSIDPTEVGIVPGDPELSYELSIYNNYQGPFSNPAPDGRYVPQYMVYIKAKSDFRAYPGKFTSTLFSKAYVGGQASDYAIVGTDSVDIENSVVDAFYVYRTGGGVYKLVATQRGRISTNSIKANSLAIWGNSMVNCSLKWGPYGNEATVLNVSAPAAWNPTGETLITKAAAASPIRVPRFHPPRDPKGSEPGAFANPGGDMVFANAPGPYSLAPGDYRSLTVMNTTLNMALPAALPNLPNNNKYYVANNVTIINATVNVAPANGAIPCDLYIGKGLNVVNSYVNYANVLSPNIPTAPPPAYPAAYVNSTLNPPPTSAYVQAQELLGSRTMRVFFVGSGAPKFKDCDFVANNSTMSLHASGKAMRVQLLNKTTLWGGVKGFRVKLTDSFLHYHRVFEP